MCRETIARQTIFKERRVLLTIELSHRTSTHCLARTLQLTSPKKNKWPNRNKEMRENSTILTSSWSKQITQVTCNLVMISILLKLRKKDNIKIREKEHMKINTGRGLPLFLRTHATNSIIHQTSRSDPLPTYFECHSLINIYFFCPIWLTAKVILISMHVISISSFIVQ